MTLRFASGGHSNLSHLIDDEGTVWSADSVELRKRLFCVNYPGDLSRDVIRNLGFIGYRQHGKNIWLVLHSRNHAQAALATALYVVAEAEKAERVIIEFTGEERPSEVVAHSEAVFRLGEISDAADLARRVHATYRDFSQLTDRSPLRPVFEHWRRAEGRCRPGELTQVANDTIGGRYLIVSQNMNRLVVEECGLGFQAPDKNWLNSARGKCLEEEHDVIYFHWVAEEYRTAMISGRPQLADIDAQILWPVVGTHRVRHRRLLLPCLDPNGSRYLFLANSALPLVHDRQLEAG